VVLTKYNIVIQQCCSTLQKVENAYPRPTTWHILYGLLNTENNIPTLNKPPTCCHNSTRYWTIEIFHCGTLIPPQVRSVATLPCEILYTIIQFKVIHKK